MKNFFFRSPQSEAILNRFDRNVHRGGLKPSELI